MWMLKKYTQLIFQKSYFDPFFLICLKNAKKLIPLLFLLFNFIQLKKMVNYLKNIEINQPKISLLQWQLKQRLFKLFD
jgi:hypothetical protein